MTIKKVETRSKLDHIILWFMLFGICTFTAGQYIPVYFVDQGFSLFFYPVLLILTVVTVYINTYNAMYLPHKDNRLYSAIISTLITLLVFIVFAFITLSKILAVWTDAGTIYTNKSNPNIKIVSRYINEGAFGGGTEPGDYEIVVNRPFTPFFKIKTSIDTTKINKNDWVK
jgi:hypothetical protein